jgi:hypothetical protein
MRKLVAFLGLPAAAVIAGAASAQTNGQTDAGAGCAAADRPVVFPQPLRPGLTLIDPTGKTVGKITGVQAAADGGVRGVQYSTDGGGAQNASPSDISFSGGDVAVLIKTETAAKCAGPVRQPVTFPAPLHPGLILIDAKGVTLGKISKVNGTAGGVIDAQYVDPGGAAHTVPAAELSYSGGEVAALAPEA